MTIAIGSYVRVLNVVETPQKNSNTEYVGALYGEIALLYMGRICRVAGHSDTIHDGLPMHVLLEHPHRTGLTYYFFTHDVVLSTKKAFNEQLARDVQRRLLTEHYESARSVS